MKKGKQDNKFNDCEKLTKKRNEKKNGLPQKEK